MSESELVGRCAVCHDPIDALNGCILLEDLVPDIDGIELRDVREAMADALSHHDGTANQALARAYADFDRTIVLHKACHDRTVLPDIYEPENWLDE